jgi:hypothetical protein
VHLDLHVDNAFERFGQRHLHHSLAPSLIQIVNQPWFKVIKHIMISGAVNPFMTKRLLRFANVPCGDLGADKLTEGPLPTCCV